VPLKQLALESLIIPIRIKKPATRCGQNINHVESDERWEGADRVLVTRPGFNDSVANVVFFKVLFKVVD
jgi:hypothetical protein